MTTSTKKRRLMAALTALFAAFLVGFAAPAGVAAPLSAERAPTAQPVPVAVAEEEAGVSPPARSDCQATYFCVWVHAGYSDGPARFAGNNTNWGAFSHSTCPGNTWSNCASSGFNNGTSGLGVQVFNGTSYTGAGACLPRGWYLSNFAGYVYPDSSVSFNDTISSNRWSSAC